MNTWTGSKLAAATAIAFSLIAGPAAAEENASDKAQIMSSAKISIAEAIAAAEKETGGKAVETDIRNRDGNAHFEITIQKGMERQEVLVDGQTGQVVKTVANDGDENDEG